MCGIYIRAHSSLSWSVFHRPGFAPGQAVLQPVVSGRSNFTPPPLVSPAYAFAYAVPPACWFVSYRPIIFQSFRSIPHRSGGILRGNRGRPAADRTGRFIRQARARLAAYHRVPAARAGEWSVCRPYCCNDETPDMNRSGAWTVTRRQGVWSEENKLQLDYGRGGGLLCVHGTSPPSVRS